MNDCDFVQTLKSQSAMGIPILMQLSNCYDQLNAYAVDIKRLQTKLRNRSNDLAVTYGTSKMLEEDKTELQAELTKATTQYGKEVECNIKLTAENHRLGKRLAAENHRLGKRLAGGAGMTLVPTKDYKRLKAENKRQDKALDFIIGKVSKFGWSDYIDEIYAMLEPPSKENKG